MASNSIDQEWRDYFKERLEHMDNSMERLVNLMEEHQRKDDTYYQQTAEMKLQQQFAWRVMKVIATGVGALGLDKVWHWFKP